MKRTMMILTMLSLAAPNAFSFEGEISYGYAKVTRVKPIIRVVETNSPKEECWREEVQVPRGNHGDVAGATIFGGLVGGLLGSQIGRGPNRVATGIIGSMTGAAIGHGLASSGRGYDVEAVRRCRVVDQPEMEEKIVGYWVDYEYRGEMYRTQMDHRPDDKIRVRISVDPVE